MRRIVRKVTAVILSAIIITAASFSVSAENIDVTSGFSSSILLVRQDYVENYPDDLELIDNVINSIVKDSQFDVIFQNDETAAIKTLKVALEDSLRQKYSIEPYDFVGTLAYCCYTVPVVKQAKTYYCGPAAVLEALIGNGILDDVSINKNLAKQNAIASALGTTSSGTYVYQITNVLNSYYSSDKYEHRYYSQSNYDSSISFLVDALQSNYVPIVRVTDTSAFSYYNGNSYTHYVAVNYVDYDKKTIGIVDPHYNTTFGGEREVTFTEFKNAIKQDGWIISY